MDKNTKKIIAMLLKNKIAFTIEYREGFPRLYIDIFTLSIVFYYETISVFNLGDNTHHGQELFINEVEQIVKKYITGK